MSHIEQSYSQSSEEEDDQVVETDSKQRYVRFEHKLGSGAFKTVYRALDTEKGIEVAWNQVFIDRHQLDKEKILQEIEFFKKIRHEHIIDFYDNWENPSKNEVVFITELMPSGTLTDYIAKSPDMKLKIIKSWCKQILKGLNYLHTSDPPIIHRDIKCANIFINGTTEGEVKIGDLGLATFCKKKDARSVIGTPEFMAPEYYNEIYSTSVDIWAFGMAMIEMVTKKCPYAECDNVGQIFRKVSGGIRPQQLDLIADDEVRSFIRLCLEDEDKRPTAEELLNHNFFLPKDNDNYPVTMIVKDSIQTSESITPPVLSLGAPNSPQKITDGDTTTIQKEESPKSFKCSIKDFVLNVIDKRGDILDIKATISTEDKSSTESSEVDFTYNLATDNVANTTTEMIKSFDYDSSSYSKIFSALNDLIKRFPTHTDINQTITELSALVCEDDLENEEITTVNGKYERILSNSGNSIQSEPPQKLHNTTRNCGIFSDSELPSFSFNNAKRKSAPTLTDLEFLVEEENSDNSIGNMSQLSVPSGTVYTDLEDLLDDENIDSDDEVNSDSSADEIFCTSEEDDEEELLALKAKHEKDLQDLKRAQKKELEEKKLYLTKKNGLYKENIHSINDISKKSSIIQYNKLSSPPSSNDNTLIAV